MIIGLSGYAQSGKDTVAGMLVGLHKYENRSFAEPMRASLLKLDPYVNEKGMRLSDAIYREGGWEWAKKNTDARRLLQQYGTEVGRNMFGENFWVDQAFKGVSVSSKVVFTDCRFPNEASRVKLYGGQVWRVRRPGYEALNAHASETSLDDYEFDQIIENDGSIQDLMDKVAILLG